MKTLSVRRQFIDDDDIDAVAQPLPRRLAHPGTFCEEFEGAFRGVCRNALRDSPSRTGNLLHGAYFAAGVETGDEVITSAAFAATKRRALSWRHARLHRTSIPRRSASTRRQRRRSLSKRTRSDRAGELCRLPGGYCAPFLRIRGRAARWSSRMPAMRSELSGTGSASERERI